MPVNRNRIKELAAQNIASEKAKVDDDEGGDDSTLKSVVLIIAMNP